MQRHLAQSLEFNITLFIRRKHHEGLTTSTCSSSSAYSVDEGCWVLRRVKLNDPIDVWDVESSRGHVSAQQGSALGRIPKPREDTVTLFLNHTAMKAQKG
mmetsp:Transcript_40602/g.55274  ORF Transcript_40602/g.55274 Transcript_40602/m.55274 type:complete len:100 (+) Transcript_40602:910-1209(+)